MRQIRGGLWAPCVQYIDPSIAQHGSVSIYMVRRIIYESGYSGGLRALCIEYTVIHIYEVFFAFKDDFVLKAGSHVSYVYRNIGYGGSSASTARSRTKPSSIVASVISRAV